MQSKTSRCHYSRQNVLSPSLLKNPGRVSTVLPFQKSSTVGVQCILHLTWMSIKGGFALPMVCARAFLSLRVFSGQASHPSSFMAPIFLMSLSITSATLLLTVGLGLESTSSNAHCLQPALFFPFIFFTIQSLGL